jgi:hypothetical protein
MGKKGTYRIRNWSEYNRALTQRGSITIWFSDDAIDKWRETKQSGGRGRPRTYSDDAILCALMIRAVHHKSLRALVGFLKSLMQLLGLSLPVPCYTRICRRAGELGQVLRRLSRRLPADVVFDSTGLKVYGEGEWKVRQHGKGRRRTWRKLHLAICPKTDEIILAELTDSSEADCEAFLRMQGHLPASVRRGYLDGAYDTSSCYRALADRNIRPIIPPRRGGVWSNEIAQPWMKPRNDALLAIHILGGDDQARKIWKKITGYHTRSLAETGMYRFKTLFGGTLKARKLHYQRAEVYAKSLAMNKMTRIGMPNSAWQAA